MFGGYNDEEGGGGFNAFGFNLNQIQFPFAQYNTNFEESYRVYSVQNLPGPSRTSVNFGGKIFLPPSALVKLSNLNISYPMLFELKFNETYTYAGVLEFIAEEGRVYIPQWMLESLQATEGDIIDICSTSLPLGTFVKIQPQSPDFLDITDPKAVLENAFRNFSCLTKQEIITISYNNKLYDILVMEIKPEGRGISIIETDLEVDFAEPLGYVEPQRPASSMSVPSTTKIENLETAVDQTKWSAFSGTGQALSNRKKKNIKQEESKEINITPNEDNVIPIPLKLPSNNLFFGYRYIPPPGQEGNEVNNQEQGSSGGFKGNGQNLKNKS